ncbi:MAG: hypothetical protein RL113_306 [Pseudomonadota bacterium]|jgi:molybdate transport system ATP-binding protein
MKLEIEKKLYGSKGVMELSVDLTIEKGSFVALMGESGSGKTTLLRILAGLENAKGRISVEGQRWLDGSKSVSPQQREIGFVFQDYALFEHMSVKENLLYVKADPLLVEELLEMTALTTLADRNVKLLSGGQKQRVSLCRAMMNRPKLLLMDEPLSALDPKMKSKLEEEILRLHERFDTTTVMVSHDTQAVYHLADRVVVLDQGKVISDGTPDSVFVKQNTVRYAFST